MEDDQKQIAFTRTMKLGAAFAIVLALGFAGGLSAGAAGGTRVFSNVSLFGGLSAIPDDSADLADFWRAWNVLDSRFVGSSASSTKPNADEKMWGAIQGLAAAYGDPYTVYMPPEEAKVFQDDISGNFEGVGMELGVGKNGILTVIAPLKGTPAERSGMRSGDEIYAIDDVPTDGMTTDEAVKLIRGPKGTPVVFRVLRDGESIDIRVVRDVIDVPTIETKAENGVFTISFYSFTGNSAQKFAEALEVFRGTGYTKLIIDLRGNPGGYLDSAVSIASRFLPKGTVIVTEDYKGNRENIVHRSLGTGGVPPGTKTVVLIDAGSASASEILAGALQDEGAATLVGTHSFGKGSVQELIDLGEGALKVTVARWMTPSGRSISDGGLAPDVAVERTREDAEAGLDPQMDKAISILQGN